MRVIIGGTFNPIHQGHCTIITHLSQKFPEAAIHIMPNNLQPMKQETTDAKIRVEMIQAALTSMACRDQVCIDSTEIQRDGPSHTRDTLISLRETYGDAVCLIWVLGDDAMNQLHQWDDWQELLEFTHLYVVGRDGLAPHIDVQHMLNNTRTNDMSALTQRPAGHCFVDDAFARMDISSTAIREQWSAIDTSHQGADLCSEPASSPSSVSLMKQLPPGVADIIQQYRLYENPTPSHTPPMRK